MFVRISAVSAALLVLCISHATSSSIDMSKVNVNNKRDNDNDTNTEIPVVVSRRSSVQRRGVSGPIDFPKDMQFIIKFGESEMALNLKKHETISTDITLSDDYGRVEHDLWRTVGVYYDDSTMASMTVECHENTTECSLMGSVVFHGQKWIITPNVKTPEFHTARRATLEEEGFAGIRTETIKKQHAKRSMQGRDTYDPSYYDKYYNYGKDLPDCYIIEIYAATDEIVWKYFLEWAYYDPVEAEKMLIKYYCFLYTEIDRRFSGFDDITAYDDCKCIRIYFAGVHITKTAGDSWSKPAEGSFDGKPAVRGEQAMRKCGKKLNSIRGQSGVPFFQLGQCFTGLPIIWTGDYDGERRLVGVLAYENTACDMYEEKFQVSLVHAGGDNTDRKAARGIARNIGAGIDGETGCDDSDRYIMSAYVDDPSYPYYYDYDTYNWHFSDCSKRDVCLFIKGLYKNCFDTPTVTAKEFWAKLNKPLPGKVYSPKEQCELRFGHDSDACDGGYYDAEICSKGLMCIVDYECTGRTRVFSGTSCGDDKICFKGECVDDTDKDSDKDYDTYSYSDNKDTYSDSDKDKYSDSYKDKYSDSYKDSYPDSYVDVKDSYPDSYVAVTDSYSDSDKDKYSDSDKDKYSDSYKDSYPDSYVDVKDSYPDSYVDVTDSYSDSYVAVTDSYSDDKDKYSDSYKDSYPDSYVDVKDSYPDSYVAVTDSYSDDKDKYSDSYRDTYSDSDKDKYSDSYSVDSFSGSYVDDKDTSSYYEKNTYKEYDGGDLCEECSKYGTCSGNLQCSAVDSYVSECQCVDPYYLDKCGDCIRDDDECAYDNWGCEQICRNTPGSFECSCMAGYVLNSDGYTCDDIDECSTNNGNCQQMCNNNDGSYTCSCYNGYTVNGFSCEDVDECSSNNGGCEQFCDNTPGSYNCECCDGYTLAYATQDCEDVDECNDSNGGCEQICYNVPGSFCCKCNDGYTLNTYDYSCDDIDECNGNHDCEQMCTNTVGSFNCECDYGYQLLPNGLSCEDTDECNYDNGGCEQFCDNTPGSYNCECGPGYKLSYNGHDCDDINECSYRNGGCEHTCTNVPGSFCCECDRGYELDYDGQTCNVINPCTIDNGGCEHNCHFDQKTGMQKCSCNRGFKLDYNGFCCNDINECDHIWVKIKCEKFKKGFCMNTPGSYRCVCCIGYYGIVDYSSDSCHRRFILNGAQNGNRLAADADGVDNSTTVSTSSIPEPTTTSP